MNKISRLPSACEAILNCTNSRPKRSEFAGHGFDSSVALEATTLVTAIAIKIENILQCDPLIPGATETAQLPTNTTHTIAVNGQCYYADTRVGIINIRNAIVP